MEKEVTILELLKITADMIGEISVPVSLADQIARPLCQAVSNLNAVIEAIPKEGEKADVQS